jgi:diadenylate cyclase
LFEVKSVKELLKLFRWQDALDIIILTFVFFRLYLWLRRKRALRMILAILALPFFYLLAEWIDLPLSVWGLQNLWAVILLACLVAFSGCTKPATTVAHTCSDDRSPGDPLPRSPPLPQAR